MFFAYLLVILAIAAIILAYGVITRGFVMYCFWYWFLIPIFPDVALITFYQAVGLSFFVSLFRTSLPSFQDGIVDDKQTTLQFVFRPWLLLGLGYLVKYFIL